MNLSCGGCGTEPKRAADARAPQTLARPPIAFEPRDAFGMRRCLAALRRFMTSGSRARGETSCRCIGAVLLFGIFVVGARAADTNAVLGAWLSAQTNLHTWMADFTQTRMLRTLTQPLVATGHVWFATPNRFRWEVRWPAPTLALRQTNQMYVVYPRLKRAERYPLDATAPGEWREALGLLEAGFPRDRADLESRFHILSLTESNGSWQLVLQPTSRFARRMISEIHIGLATNNFSLTSTELMSADGSRMRNDFTNSILNPPFGDTVFDWEPGAGYKVTEPFAK